MGRSPFGGRQPTSATAAAVTWRNKDTTWAVVKTHLLYLLREIAQQVTFPCVLPSQKFSNVRKREMMQSAIWRYGDMMVTVSNSGK